MKIRTTVEGKPVDATSAIVEMKSGDQLSIGVLGPGKEFRTISVSVHGFIIIVTHEQTDDSMVIRPSRTEYVKGSE